MKYTYNFIFLLFIYTFSVMRLNKNLQVSYSCCLFQFFISKCSVTLLYCSTCYQTVSSYGDEHNTKPSTGQMLATAASPITPSQCHKLENYIIIFFLSFILFIIFYFFTNQHLRDWWHGPLTCRDPNYKCFFLQTREGSHY